MYFLVIIIHVQQPISIQFYHLDFSIFSSIYFFLWFITITSSTATTNVVTLAPHHYTCCNCSVIHSVSVTHTEWYYPFLFYVTSYFPHYYELSLTILRKVLINMPPVSTRIFQASCSYSCAIFLYFFWRFYFETPHDQN